MSAVIVRHGGGQLGNIGEVQEWLRSSNLAGIVVPSTDEFLSEFTPPPDRRLLWLTGFRGSVGLAVILRDAAAIFLDGRYFRQAADDVDTSRIDVEPATSEARSAWLIRSLPAGARIGIDPWLHAAPDLAQWQTLAKEIGFELQQLKSPIDQLWVEGRPAKYEPRIVDFPTVVAGDDYRVKCASLVEHMKARKLEALLIADPEDVSWLLNVRAAEDAIKVAVGEWHIVPSCTSRALISKGGGVTWFVDDARLAAEVIARGCENVRFEKPEKILDALRSAALIGAVGADIRRTPAVLAQVIEEAGGLRADDTIARRRWCKNPAEVRAARRAHVTDAVAVVKFMAWLVRTVPLRPVTEFEAAERLHAFREEHADFIAASMPAMSASGLSGAQPHYVPRREACRRLNDHPIYWMDSGGQYRGGTTDNTITVALGPPEQKHILAHTLLLQGFIALATARAPVGTAAYRLDPLARQALWREGMDYAHGTGHGVGNFLNIHEGPLITRDAIPISVVPLEPGMILSNEPGYYAADDFGMRIESHMVVVASALPNFIEFEIISRLPIDPRLLDFERLSRFERQWLATYHRKVLQDIEPALDGLSAAWLRQLVESFNGAELRREHSSNPVSGSSRCHRWRR